MLSVTSRKASSSDSGSTRGVYCSKMDWMTCETSAYRSMRTGRTMPCGHSRTAWAIGMALWTPNLRASYDAAETTPRLFTSPPTMTAWPLSSGRSRCSTDA